MTAQRRAEETLQQANELLERRIDARTAELQAAKDAAEAAEREARASHEHFLAAAESLMDGLAIYDAEDRLVYHNSRYPDHAPPAFRAVIGLGARFEDMVRSAVEGGGMYHPDMGEDFVAHRLAHHTATVRGSGVPDRRRPLDPGARERPAERRAGPPDERHHGAKGGPARARGARAAAAADRRRHPAADRDHPDQPARGAVRQRAGERDLQPAPRPATRGDPGAYVDPGDRKLLVEQLYRDGRVDNLEVRLRRADGTAMWALLSARAITVRGQLAMLTSVTDISERKAAQVELEEREQRFRAIAEGVPLSIAIARIDPPEILFANARADETFGFRAGVAERCGPRASMCTRRSARRWSSGSPARAGSTISSSSCAGSTAAPCGRCCRRGR